MWWRMALVSSLIFKESFKYFTTVYVGFELGVNKLDLVSEI